MKFIFVFFAAVSGLFAATVPTISPAFRVATVSSSYLLNQNFEGTATTFDNGEVWQTFSTVVTNYSTAPAPLVGSGSCFLNGSFAQIINTNLAPIADVWGFCVLRPTDWWAQSGSPIEEFHFVDAANVTQCGLRMAYLGGTQVVTLYANGADSTVSTTLLSRNTTYYVWIHFVSGGTCAGYMSTSSTRPTVDGGGNVVLTKTGASANVVGVKVLQSFADPLITDRVLISASSIGDNP